MTRPCPRCGELLVDGAQFCRACGTAIQPTASSGPSSRRLGLGRARRVLRWRPRTRRAKAAIAAAVAAVVLGTGAAVWSGQAAHPPAEPIIAYFDALARHDTAAARDMVGGSTALADDALAHGYEAPTGLEIGDVTYGLPTDAMKRPNKNIAYVKVRYQVGGTVVEGSIEVYRDREGPVRPWSLGDGVLGPVDIVSPVAEQARMADATVRTLASKRTKGTAEAVWAPPGIYTVTAVANDPLFTSDPVTVTVPAGQHEPSRTTTVELALTVRPEAVAEISKQIKAQLDECARQDDLHPVGCSLKYSGLDTLGAVGIKWRITAYPKIRLVPSGSRHTGGLADVETVTPGRATVTFTRNGVPGERTVEIEPGGSVRVLADETLCWNRNSSALACGDMD